MLLSCECDVPAPCPTDMCTSSPQTAEELESRNKLLRLLDSVIDALVWAISKMGLSTQQQTLRLGHLTMLLSHIRHVRYGDTRTERSDSVTEAVKTCVSADTETLKQINY